MSELVRSHLAKPGYTAVGYHYIIDGNGKVHKGRPFEKAGAHCYGENFDSIGICVMGDNTRDGRQWSPAQWRALFNLVASIREVFCENLPIYGHRDTPGAATLCPGLDIRAQFGGSQ